MLLTKLSTYGTIYTYISCILTILCFYIVWIAAYEFNNESTLGILLIVLGIMYACAIYLVSASHPYSGSCIIICTIAIVIAIATVSGFKQKNGSRGGNFICLGITPMLSGICFVIIAGAISQAVAQGERFKMI